jgi:hypothetical protein
MAKTTFLSWSTTAGSNTDIDGIGILGSNAVNNFDDAFRTIMAQLRRDIDGKIVYANKSANYTALADDNNAVHRYTAAATVALTAAATLGNNWHYTVFADGGAVIIDPNASELINGATTYTVQDGSIATIICDGSAFRVFISGLTGESLNGGPLGGLQNAIINGAFDVGKRATSVAAGTGFKYLTDRWARVSAGSTMAFSRQEFATGVTIPPGNTRWYGRFTVVSSAGATNYAAVYQAMEDVRTYAGKTVTATFYAKADASKNIGFELYQWFGLGGSPSSAITGIGAQQCALTTSWQRFDILVNVPSISGKTRGTDGNDHLELVFWLDAGSTFASRASSIGQQSITFDMTRVSIREGDCRNEVDPFCPRHIEQEEDLCARYFQTWTDLMVAGYNSTGNAIYAQVTQSPQMRGNFTTPVFSLNSNAASNASGLALHAGNNQRFRVAANITATGAGFIMYDVTADFEI